jgi:hypothetical protein
MVNPQRELRNMTEKKTIAIIVGSGNKRPLLQFPTATERKLSTNVQTDKYTSNMIL